MSFTDQLIKLKDNWFLVLLVIIAFLAFTFLLSSGASFSAIKNIGYEQMDSSRSAMAYDSYGSMPGYGSSDFAPDVEERIITKNSSLTLEVKGGEFLQAETKIKNIAKTSDSFILRENSYSTKVGNKDVFKGSYNLRVESEKLESVVSQLKDVGKVTYFNEGLDDITGNYTNRQIEIDIEKGRLERYQTLYQTTVDENSKIKLINEIYNVERKIKYLEDSLKNMDQRVEYSTVSISLNEKYSYSNIMFVKLSDLVRSLVNSINALLKFIFVILPFVIVGYIIYILARKKKKEDIVKKR